MDKTKSDEALVKELGATNPKLGILVFTMPDGSKRKFQGNRAQRRRFIRMNHLVKGGKDVR